MHAVELRLVKASDLDAIFEQMRDPASVQMAAFTAEDPNDRMAFDAHMAKVMSSPDITHMSVTYGDVFVGTIGCFISEGKMEVTYWIDRSYWGRGIASRALTLMLVEVSVRPVRARVAVDNIGSLRVLEKSGFQVLGKERSFATARGKDIDETILELL